MRSLQLRITLAILLVVVVVTSSVGAALYRRLEDQGSREFDATVEAARAAVTARLERDAAALEGRVEALRGHASLTRLLNDLREGRWDTNPAVQRRVVEDAQQLMTGASLDVLWILDHQEGHRLLAAPHHLGGDVLPPALQRHLERGMESFVVSRELISRHGRPVELVVLEKGVRAGRLTLVGGRVVGRGVASDLQAGLAGRPTIEVRDGGGELLASTEDEASGADGQRAQVVHRNPGSPSAALVVDVVVSRAQLRTRRKELAFTLLSTMGLGVVFGLLLGRFLARRVTSSLRALAQAAQSIGLGERDVALPAAGKDEVGELVEAFDRMRRELDENDERLRRAERVAAWQDIARELAHEIKNPLTPIQMAMETLRRAHARQHPKFDELFAESTETILEEVARLAKIVSEFSQFARMPNPEPREHELNDVVHSVTVLYRDGEADVFETLDPTVGRILIDPERMTQVVQNLVLNALHATRGQDRKGRIELTTRRLDDERVELTVQDNGHGIPTEDLPRVFTPYFTAKAGGTGLGLAVAHRIVSGHGGRIGVRSEIGEGTCFVVQLPG